MGIFRNLTTATKATLKAVSDGAEMLAEASEEWRKASERKLLATRAARWESEFHLKSGNKDNVAELRRIWNELSPIYDELWLVSNSEQRHSISAEKKKVFSGIRRAEVRELKDEIEEIKGRISRQPSLRPIDEIHLLGRIKSKLLQVASKLSTEKLEPARGRVIDEIAGFNKRIDKLEAARYETATEQYPGGERKAFIQMRDGMLHGKADGWYPSGKRKLEIMFEGGKFQGEATMWREDKTVLNRSRRLANGGVEHHVYLDDGRKIASACFRGNEVSVSLWLWDGYFLGTGNGPNVDSATRNLKFWSACNPIVWIKLFKASRSHPAKEAFEKMIESVRPAQNLIIEVQRLQSKYG